MEMLACLKQIDLFQGLSDSEYQQLIEITKHRTIKKNTLIFSKGDENHALFILFQGSVDVFNVTENGKELILNTLSTGQYFGELSVLDEEMISANIITVVDCIFLVIHKTDFLQLLKKSDVIMQNIIHHLCLKVRQLTDKVESFALLDVYHRLTLLLLDLSELMPDGQRVIKKPLTHKNIALRIGSSREMVSRILKDLESGQYIRVDHKQITLCKELPESW